MFDRGPADPGTRPGRAEQPVISVAFTAAVYATAHPDPRQDDVDAMAASALGMDSLRNTLGDSASSVLDDKSIER